MKKILGLIALVSAAISLTACGYAPVSAPFGEVRFVYAPAPTETDGHYSIQLVTMNGDNDPHYGSYECQDNADCKDLKPGQHITFVWVDKDTKISRVRVAINPQDQ